jgi:predicted AlkP superfamily phosphohydrolase/phosphomutase
VKQSDSKKLIIIGLDGATFDVLDPYIQKGVLPNIERLIHEGVKGKLDSTIPPVTGPSWVSFMTGMWPGKHGIYDFVKPMPNSIKRQAISYQDIRSSTIWSYLDKAGKKVGIVNLPITYPTPKVDGFIIPGLLTPNTEGEFAYPEGLMAELHREIGEYVFDVWWQRYGKSGVKKFLDELLYCTSQRIKTMSYLLEKKEWDVFTGVFIGTDRVQHYIWQYIHPRYEKGLTKREQEIVSKIAEYYKQIDNFLGNLIKIFDMKADIIVMSDHGFGPLQKKVYINRWLEENGYLTIDRKKARLVSITRNLLNLIRIIVKALDYWNLRKKIQVKKRLHRMSAYDFLDCINWSKTLAYSASSTEQGIYINLRGREPYGIVNGGGEYERIRDEIIQRLKELRDPETGEKVVTQIFKREVLYQGSFVKNAPDIILFLKNGEWLIDVQLKEHLYEDAGWHTGFGTHRLDGIFIGHGPNIKKGAEITGLRIVDIAPTILYQQGLSIPDKMDGRPILQIFNEEFLKTRPLLYTHDENHQSLKKEDDRTLSEQELEQIEKNLKGLGYL